MFAYLFGPSTSFADNHSDIDSGGVAMQDMLRLSTETQRRNGFVQSAAEDRGTRITEDMRNGNYACSICADAVMSVAGQDVWHCRDCYNVFHLACISRWADTNGGSSLRTGFKCPYCSVLHEGEPNPSCWCGKYAFATGNTNSPNACWDFCGKATQCPHGFPAQICDKICHPGPCNSPCKADCPRPTVPAAQDSTLVVPKPPNALSRVLARASQRPPGTLGTLVSYSILLILIYAALSAFTIYHIRWWTQPYRYPEFSDKYSGLEILLASLVGILLLVCIVGLLIEDCTGWGSFLSAILNLNSGTKQGRKLATTFFGTMILGLIATGVLVLPFVGLLGGPGIAWYNQMRKSCSGYDTRIPLDRNSRPSQKLNIRSLSHTNENVTFYLASRLQPVSYSTAPFQFYYRLSVTTNTHKAVDVDLHNRLWRVSLLSNPDDANQFMASQFDKEYQKVPPFYLIEESPVQNGTFSDVSSTAKHMDIPELDLRMANMYDFLDSCDQEPFLRVYRTANKTEQAKEKISSELWSSKDDKDIVMRTASFGHGRQRLDLCVKEEKISQPSGQEAAVKTMDDELLVPMAILTAHRLRLWEKDVRDFDCKI